MSIAYSARGNASPGEFVAAGDVAFPIGAALREGDGVVVVPESDTVLQAVLDNHPALKRVAVPDNADQLADSLEALPAAALRDEAKQRGLKAAGSKDEILAAIRTHDAEQAGDSQSAELANNESKED